MGITHRPMMKIALAPVLTNGKMERTIVMKKIFVKIVFGFLVSCLSLSLMAQTVTGTIDVWNGDSTDVNGSDDPEMFYVTLPKGNCDLLINANPAISQANFNKTRYRTLLAATKIDGSVINQSMCMNISIPNTFEVNETVDPNYYSSSQYNQQGASDRNPCTGSVQITDTEPFLRIWFAIVHANIRAGDIYDFTTFRLDRSLNARAAFNYISVSYSCSTL